MSHAAVVRLAGSTALLKNAWQALAGNKNTAPGPDSIEAPDPAEKLESNARKDRSIRERPDRVPRTD